MQPSKNKLSLHPLRATLRDICTPLGLEVILCVVLALLVYGAVFYKRLFTALSGGEPLPPDYFHNIITNLFTPIDNLSFMSSLGGAILWSLGGVIVYIFIITLIKMVMYLKNISNVLETSKGIETKIVSLSYELKRGFWILLAIFSVYWYIKLVQYLLLRANNDLTARNWLYLLLGVGAMSAANYILYILINLVRRNPSLLDLKQD